MAIFYQPPEPRQAYPKVLPQTQGAQPKPAGPLGGSVNALTAIGVWATLAAVPMPVQKPLDVVPLTLRYGSQPVPQAPLSTTHTNVTVRSWDPPRQEPPALIGVAAIKGIPAPPVYVPFNPTNPAIGLWPQPDWRAQSGPEIATLTLRRGDTVLVVRQQLPSAAPGWPAQSSPSSAAWNVPAVVSTFVLVGSEAPPWIYGYWNSPVLDIQYSGAFTPVSAPPDQPPVEGALTVVDIALLRSTWEPPRQEPPRPVAIATLTLPRGDTAPFARPPIIWPALDWPYQSEENNAGWNFVPPVVSQTTPLALQQHVIRYQWEPAFVYPASEADNAAWNIPAIVSQPSPYVRFRIHYVAPAISWPSQHASPVAAFVNAVVAVTLDLAIAHSDGADSLVSSSDASGTLIQNSGLIAIVSSDSKTIQIITGNSGVISLDSDG